MKFFTEEKYPTKTKEKDYLQDCYSGDGHEYYKTKKLEVPITSGGVDSNYVAPAYRRKWVLRVTCGEWTKDLSDWTTKTMYFADRTGSKLTKNFSDAYIHNSKQSAEQVAKYWAKDVDTIESQLKDKYSIEEPIPTPIDITVMLPNIEENADLFK